MKQLRRYKKILIWLLCALLLGGCAAPRSQETELSLYYRRKETDFSQGTLTACESMRYEAPLDVQALAQRYFEGPVSETLVTPFPKQTALVSYRVENGVLHLTLSGGFSGLTKADYSLALTCLGATFFQLDGIEALECTLQDGPLDQNATVYLEKDQILLMDNTGDLLENTVKVYYANASGRYLIEQSAKTTLETVQEQAKFAISLLEQRPADNALHKTLPDGTKILNLSIENGLCSLDLSSEFYRNRPESAEEERMTIFSIVNTLTEFPEINAVQFYVEGELLEQYQQMDLTLAYQREERAIGPIRAVLNEFDASLYLVRDRDGVLTEVPTKLKVAANETQAEVVVQTLLQEPAQNGLHTALADHTSLRSIRMEGSCCVVDFSEQFTENLKTEAAKNQAAEAVTASLMALDGIEDVRILIDGVQAFSGSEDSSAS